MWPFLSCTLYIPIILLQVEVCPERNQLAKDLGLDTVSATGPLLNCILQRSARTTVTSPAQQPLSTASPLTSAHRQPPHSEGPGTQSRVTVTASMPQPGSLSTTTALDGVFSNPTQKPGTSAKDLPPLDYAPFPDSLNMSSEHSVSTHADDHSLFKSTHDHSAFKPAHGIPTHHESLFKTTHHADDHSSFKQDGSGFVSDAATGIRKTGGPLNVELSGEEQLNGKRAKEDKLDDFYDTKSVINTLA